MALIGCIGTPGTGKSFTAVVIALKFANQTSRNIVSNLCINPRALYYYARLQGLKNIQKAVKQNKVIYVNTVDPECIAALGSLTESVMIFDEVGVYLHKRDRKLNYAVEFFKRLALSRHDRIDFLYTAQCEDQIPPDIWDLTEYVFLARSVSGYSPSLNIDVMLWKNITGFKSRREYFDFKSSRNAKPSKQFLSGVRNVVGFVNYYDLLLFNIYNSMSDPANEMAALSNFKYKKAHSKTPTAKKRLKDWQEASADGPRIKTNKDFIADTSAEPDYWELDYFYAVYEEHPVFKQNNPTLIIFRFLTFFLPPSTLGLIVKTDIWWTIICNLRKAFVIDIDIENFRIEFRASLWLKKVLRFEEWLGI